MHEIEPYYQWIEQYNASQDELSPFFGRQYSEFEFSNVIYNHYIHPQWDEFGSATLFMKLLYSDYSRGYAIIELFGEWNDCLYNDIMFLKRNVFDILASNGINKYILIGEHVLNFHYSDDCYYQEWYEDIENGWIVALNFRDFVINEFRKIMLHHYIYFGGDFNSFNWRRFSPSQLFECIDSLISRRLSA